MKPTAPAHPAGRATGHHLLTYLAAFFLSWAALCSAWAQAGPGGPPPGGPFGGGRPGGGPGGMMSSEAKLVKQFDRDGDQRLNTAERQAAREFLAKERAEGRLRQRGPGRRPGGEGAVAVQPGLKVSPADVAPVVGKDLYDTSVVRTLFLDFENADWEKELMEFNNTDVEVPAKLTVDGKTYADVGVHFRGASSFFTVPEGRKHSLNLSLDFAHENQNVGGYRTLNLLNSHEDPTFLRTVLYLQVAREYVPAPKANFVRVVINGESWGVYVNAEQFNKDFVQARYGTAKGARFKAPGSPNGRANFAYLGDKADDYRRAYDLKTKDDPKVWADLIRLCRVLNQTPADQLEAALAPLLDVDGALKFLALENALINNDGYWIRTSDYALYQDTKGRFHILPHDANETFLTPGGPGFGGRGRGGPGGPGGGGSGASPVKGVELDPLFAANDANKPLISKLLAVPSLRTRYLAYVREIADKWLDWNRLGPVATQHHSLIAPEVKADTRKLDSYEAFVQGLTATVRGEGFGPMGGNKIGLKEFADQRRAYLLQYSPQPAGQ